MATCSTPVRLDCPICKKKMIQPMTFKCLHFFCKTCVDDMKPATEESETEECVTGYKCPICSELTQTEECTEMDFVSQLIDIDGKDETERKCDKCQTETPTNRCLDCKENFCKGCRDSHNSWSVLKNHKWEELTDITDSVIDQFVYCPTHADDTIRLHCKQCQKLICMVCMETTHRDHPFEAIKIALEELLQKITQQKEDAQTVLQENEKSLNGTINYAEGLKKEYEEIEERIDKKCEAIITKARADCKTAKEELATIKEQQIDIVETYIKDIELRLKTGKNTITLTDAALLKAKNTSLFEIIHGQLSERLVKSARERYSEASIVTGIRATFEPRDIDENIVGAICDTNNHIPCNLKELGPCTSKWTRPDVFMYRRKFIQIRDRLWIAQGTNKISYFSKDFTELETEEYEQTGQIWSLAQFRSIVLIAASNGLYSIDHNGDNIHNIMTGAFCDLTVQGNNVYALDNGKGKVQMFTYDRESRTFQNQRSIEVADYKEDDWNTIQITSGYIYLAEHQSHRIKKFQHNGTLRALIGTKGRDIGQFKWPRICGSDAYNNLLIADDENHRLLVLMPDDSLRDLNLIGLAHPAYAGFVEGDLVVLECNGGIKRFEVEQYVNI